MIDGRSTVAPFPQDTTDGFSLSYERTDDEVMVHLRGELDIAGVPLLRHVLGDLIDDQGNLTVILDLSCLDFIDGSGLGVLVGAQRAMADRGRRIVPRAPTRQVGMVLQVTGLDQAFTTYQLSTRSDPT